MTRKKSETSRGDLAKLTMPKGCSGLKRDKNEEDWKGMSKQMELSFTEL